MKVLYHFNNGHYFNSEQKCNGRPSTEKRLDLERPRVEGATGVRVVGSVSPFCEVQFR